VQINLYKMIVDHKLNKQFVGVYFLDGTTDSTQLVTNIKPNGFRRFMTRLFIGNGLVFKN